jgi:nicotinate phosphoribosyltransferase
MKLSAEKSNLPGRKQVVRQYEEGLAVRDVLATESEQLSGAPLLERVMANGERTEAGVSRPLTAIREHASARLSELPERLRALNPDVPGHEVVLSDGLEERLNTTRKALENQMAAEAA